MAIDKKQFLKNKHHYKQTGGDKTTWKSFWPDLLYYLYLFLTSLWITFKLVEQFTKLGLVYVRTRVVVVQLGSQVKG